jgi:hypothetical protein
VAGDPLVVAETEIDMGIMNHNTIITTTWSEECFDKLMLWVNEQSEDLRNLCVAGDAQTNGERTICIVPDGSKEGWPESDKADSLRQSLIERLEADAYDGGSSPWCWVEVGFGKFGQKVLRGNNRNMYDDREYAVSLRGVSSAIDGLRNELQEIRQEIHELKFPLD